MSVNCIENCGKLRNAERTNSSVVDMRTIGRGVLGSIEGLALQAAIVIAVLSTSAAPIVRSIIRKKSSIRTICNNFLAATLIQLQPTSILVRKGKGAEMNRRRTLLPLSAALAFAVLPLQGHAVFAANGNLGNLSGYNQGEPDYERLINVVHDATERL